MSKNNVVIFPTTTNSELEGSICDTCGHARLKKKIIDKSVDYRGTTNNIINYITYECPLCEEVITDPLTLQLYNSEIKKIREQTDLFINFNKMLNNSIYGIYKTNKEKYAYYNND